VLGTVSRVPRALLAAVLATVLAAVTAVPATAQFRPSPWATVNLCDPPQSPSRIGVRVSVPNRRDAAQWVRIRIQFFDSARQAWRVVRAGGEGGFTKLSDGGTRVLGGTTFPFTPPPAGTSIKLRGLVDVEWRRGRRVVSRAQVTTRGGHADAADPLLQVSVATCEIRR
jgi:hypothetical protein